MFLGWVCSLNPKPETEASKGWWKAWEGKLRVGLGIQKPIVLRIIPSK